MDKKTAGRAVRQMDAQTHGQEEDRQAGGQAGRQTIRQTEIKKMHKQTHG